MTAGIFWQEFLNSTGLDSSAKYRSSFYFDTNEEGANKCLQLVLSGKQTATTGSLLAHERRGSKPPQAGDYNIVTDWNGVPHCVIRTIAVILTK